MAKTYAKELEKQTQGLAKRICELQSDLAREKSKNEKITERFEKEKCELLSLIQAKDKLIEKMKNCDNCKFKNCGMKEIQKESKLVCEEWELAE